MAPLHKIYHPESRVSNCNSNCKSATNEETKNEGLGNLNVTLLCHSSANDRHKIVGPFLLVLGLQDRWQPIREDQLAMRTNDCWLPGETGPMTNGRGPTILCLSFQLKMEERETALQLD